MTSLFLFDSFCFSDTAEVPAAADDDEISDGEEETQETVESSTPDMIKALKERLDQVILAENALLDASIENDYMRSQLAQLESKLSTKDSGKNEVWTNISSRDVSRRNSIDSHESLRIPSPRTTDSSPRTSCRVHEPIAVVRSSLDTKDLETISNVNAFLKKLADDVVFQEKLKKETVKGAFVYWSGGDVSSIEHKADEIKQCEVVRSIYPILDNFEAMCIKSNIKTPLDHIAQGKSQLDQEVLIRSFGAQFCETYCLLSADEKPVKGGWLFNY